MGKILRILNVDDSEQDALLVNSHLSGAGYEVVSDRVDTAEAMLAMLTSRNWDIILCDYSLPNFSALEALATLHGSGQDIPLIVISGTVGEDIAVEAMLSGANDYLTKDNLTRLIPAIERELTESENRRGQRQAEMERKVIFEIIQGIISTPNLDDFFTLVYRSIKQLVYAENCFIILKESKSDNVHFEFWADKYDPRPDQCLADKGFASYVMRTGKPLLRTEPVKKWLCDEGEAEIVGTASASWIGVPLRTPIRTIGALVLQHYEVENVYTERDLDFLSTVGDQIALAIERKRSEEALRESEGRYRMLFDYAPDGIIITDPEAYYLDANASICRMLGYTHGELVGLNAAEVVSIIDIGQINTAIDEINLTANHHLEWQCRRRDGSIFAADVIATKMPDNNLLAMIRDVTDRKRSAEALGKSEERYRDLVENAIDMIYTHDLNGNYTSINRAAERITGYTRDEILSMNVAQIVAPEFLEKAQKMGAAKLVGKADTAFEIEILAKDGRRIAIEVTIQLIHENGIPVSIQGIARDMTERKHLEDQFRQSQKMEAIGLLAGGIAHDFNNLLTAISGYSELTLSKMSADNPLRHNIDEIKDAGDRAAALTSQLLAFSRKQVLKPRVHNLNSVITDIEKMLRRIIRESVEFRTILDPDLQNIKADPGQIEQVIMNLSVNARHAMPKGGSLTIKTENVVVDIGQAVQDLNLMPGRYAKMTVVDTGEGMNEDTQKHMFEPFFTTKEAGKGTGLGLSTVYGIVKQSGGGTLVRSKLGHGTTFEIYLPSVEDEAQAIKLNGNRAREETVNETILLVEDEDVVRNLVREILTNKGYKVLEASSGYEALAICESRTDSIHLLLTDVIMPKMSGLELKDGVQKLIPEIKVLLMSGYSDDSISPANGLGANTAFIEKPFTPDNLAHKVREALTLQDKRYGDRDLPQQGSK